MIPFHYGCCVMVFVCLESIVGIPSACIVQINIKRFGTESILPALETPVFTFGQFRDSRFDLQTNIFQNFRLLMAAIRFKKVIEIPSTFPNRPSLLAF